MIRLTLSVIAASAFMVACGGGVEEEQPEGSRGPLECEDDFDNDQDGLIDCEDPDCCEFEVCNAAPECTDTNSSTGTTMTTETTESGCDATATTALRIGHAVLGEFAEYATHDEVTLVAAPQGGFGVAIYIETEGLVANAEV